MVILSFEITMRHEIIHLAFVSFYWYDMYQKESVVPNKNGKVQFQPWPRSIAQFISVKGFDLGLRVQIQSYNI